MECPKCRVQNSEQNRFCSQCGAPLSSSDEKSPSSTRTLIASLKELPIGGTFAQRYQVIEEIGIGGMGRVYKVMDTTIHEKVALKLLNPEIASEANTIDRFRNELKLARKISHRHVCRMYDLSEADGTLFITMEYISGEDLKSLIRRAGQISVGKAVHIIEQVSRGLHEAHHLGVIHRDLKPQNIMIDMEGNAKITDFGIARSTKSKGLTDTGIIIGTPEYMSPEQVEGKDVDLRTDIYSLGVVLYELVTGRLPFEGDTPLSVAVKHKIEQPKAPKDINAQIPPELNRLILKCMNKDRRNRYQSIDELLHDLENIKKGVSTTEKVLPQRKTRISRQLTVTLNTKKIIIPVAVGALALLLVLLLLPFIPAKRRISAGGGLPSLAVMYFENNTGDEQLDHWRKGLSDLLISDLSQSRYLRILSGERLSDILDKLNLLEAKTYSSEDLMDIAERGEVENVLVGRYVQAGGIWRISIMLQNARSGDILGSETVQGEGEASMFDMVDQLTMKIKTTFKLTSREIAEDIDEDAGTLTTSSPEAFGFYSQGVDFFKKGDYPNTIAMMETAVGLDPRFAMAYRVLSLAYLQLGYRSEGLARGQLAFDLSEHVSERERFTIQGLYYSQSEKTFQLAIDAYKNLIELYPGDESGNNNLGSLYLELEDWEAALQRFEVNVRLKNDSIQLYSNLSSAYANRGEYGKSIEALLTGIEAVSDNPTFHFILAQIYLIQGQMKLANEEAGRVFSLDPSHYYNSALRGDLALYSGDLEEAERRYLELLETGEPSVHFMGLMRSGMLNLMRGAVERSEARFQEGIELAEMLGDSVQKSAFHFNLAYLFFAVGDYTRALAECDRGWISAEEAAASEMQRRILHLKGMILLKQGSLAKALTAAQDLNHLIGMSMKKNSIRYLHHLSGAISETQGRSKEAIDSLQKAVSLLPAVFEAGNRNALFHYELASAFLGAGETEMARQQFETVVSFTVGRMDCGDLFVRALHDLGNLYLENGDKEKAKENFERFLNILKESSIMSSEIGDVKKKLASLNGIS